MKRLLGLAVLFVVLSLCVPASYGQPSNYFFIYNISTTVTGADAHTNAKVTIPMKGYLVLQFADGCDLLVDANLILYGNDTNTPKKKVYVQLNQSDSAGLLEAHVWYVSDLIFVDFWSKLPFGFEMTLQGKRTLKDIGFGALEKKQMAGSIKGVTIVWDNFLLGPDGSQDVSGTATASASIYTVATKSVNLNSWTPDEIIDELKSILTDKGYVAATLP